MPGDDTFVSSAIDAAIRTLVELEATLSVANIRKILLIAGVGAVISSKAIDERLSRYLAQHKEQ
jgi:ATP-dependent protease HslVU (ClpYQ) peptidase subunit